MEKEIAKLKNLFQLLSIPTRAEIGHRFRFDADDWFPTIPSNLEKIYMALILSHAFNPNGYHNVFLNLSAQKIKVVEFGKGKTVSPILIWNQFSTKNTITLYEHLGFFGFNTSFFNR